MTTKYTMSFVRIMNIVGRISVNLSERGLWRLNIQSPVYNITTVSTEYPFSVHERNGDGGSTFGRAKTDVRVFGVLP